MNHRVKILFLCHGNSCHNQMAEGWARSLHGDRLEPYSAGTAPKDVDPLAVRVMAEAGVDIGGYQSKPVAAVLGIDFDCVVTLCEAAPDACPHFPGGKRLLHRAFDDPPALARTAKPEEEVLDCYRRVRDEIRQFIHQLALEYQQPHVCTGVKS
jgi:arsenate reductase